ncbi:MAG: Flp pilus assembly protein CpaB [Candidatus Dormibacteraeota bacterium]|nr:Flp pilus assembly protein CpaB [Candidatus Dormibacteraeota bacterium]
MIAVVLAVVLGGSAAVGVRQYVGQAQAETVPVVVAAHDVPRGMLLSPDLVKTRNYPKELVPDGAVLKTEDVVERSAFNSLAKNEPLLDSKLSPKGHRGLASLVPMGMRAFTITTTSVAAGVAGFVLPGNRVDVLLTVQSSGNNDLTGGGSTTTLLQDVEILAVDQRIEAPADNKVKAEELRSVTLLVTPVQATRLDLGQNKGTLHLSLRNPQDGLAARVRPATVNDIQFFREKPWDQRAKEVLRSLGDALARAPKPTPPPPPAAARPRTPSQAVIRTIRGNREGAVMITFPDNPD